MSERSLARSSNAFGFDLYQRLRRKPGNLVISPASLSTALTMTWGGARGATARQMRTVLHLKGPADEVRATSGQLTRSLQDPSRPLVFRIANQLFVEQTCELVPAFVEKTREAFGAPAEPLDFERAPEQARYRRCFARACSASPRSAASRYWRFPTRVARCR